MKLHNIAEAEAALAEFIPAKGLLKPKDTTLDRIIPLMNLLGNPEQKLRVVHIAGTSGKTSTAYYIAGMIQLTGARVALTVSPHVDSITERIQIDGKPLPENIFVRELEEFLGIVSSCSIKPSYFELLYAFAIWEGYRLDVDYMIVETGLGGLHDATNVITRIDKLCVITDIGFDHMHILGNTLPEIALQKIGIVHEGNVVCAFKQSAEIMDVFSDWTKQHHAQLLVVHEEEQRQKMALDFGRMPNFQQRNWLLANFAYSYLVDRDGLESLNKAELEQAMQIQVPGRMDISLVGSKTIVMDGAHNVQKMSAFIASFKQLYPDLKPDVLIALKNDKEFEAVVPLVSAFSEKVIVTSFNTAQDLPVQSQDPSVIQDSFIRSGFENVVCIIDPFEAYSELLISDNKVCVVTGSFYLLSVIRKQLNR
jgi:dihydrofolate synthase/folylpolyglutamate synthase